MNRTSYIIFIFLLVANSYAQQSLTVDYKITFNSQKVENDTIKKHLNKIEDAPEVVKTYSKGIALLSSIKMILNANQNSAVFTGVNQMDNDVNPFESKLAKIMSELETKYYYNIKPNECKKWFKFLNKKYIYKDSISIKNWKITNQSKTIDKYVCYLATTDYVEYVNGKKQLHKVSAWFAPEIPFRFGPRGFYNLPGLILELNFKTLIYTATQIKFHKNSQELEKVPKGEFISKEELSYKIAKLKEERRNN